MNAVSLRIDNYPTSAKSEAKEPNSTHNSSGKYQLLHYINFKISGLSKLKASSLSVVYFNFLLLITLLGCQNEAPPPNPSGTLEATEIDVSSTLPGEVLEVRFELGDKVNISDTLVILDTELLRLQRAQLESGRGTINAQRKLAKSTISQAIRNLEWLETSLARVNNLLQEGNATQFQVDELTAKYDLAQLQVTNAQNQLGVLDSEELRLNSSLAVFDRQLEEAVITAPKSGSVILKSIETGEIAQPGKTLLRIADLSRMKVKIYLAEEDLDKVKVGSKLPVLIDALEGEAINGTVSWVSPEAEFTPKNTQTRDARTQLVFAVKLLIENPDGRLHIGMPAEVKL